jgi:hypothetical protein
MITAVRERDCGNAPRRSALGPLPADGQRGTGIIAPGPAA